ncbi:MAG: hypothetical protein ACP5TV_00750 [Anaerolineae bacterium]
MQYPAPSFSRRVQEHVMPYFPPSSASIMLGPYPKTALYVKPEQTQSLVSEIASLLGRLQQKGLRVPEPRTVLDYLVEFPELIDVVEKVVNIAQIRLPDAQLSLELCQDPEFEGSYLALYVRFNQYDDRVIERLDLIEDEYLTLMEGKRGSLLITTDFRPPE